MCMVHTYISWVVSQQNLTFHFKIANQQNVCFLFSHKNYDFFKFTLLIPVFHRCFYNIDIAKFLKTK